MDRQKIERSIKGLSEWQMHVQAESDIDTNISTAIEALKAQLSLEGTTSDQPVATDTNVGNKSEIPNSSDCISRQAAIDIERNATVDTNPSHFEAHQKFTQFMDDAEVSSFGRWQWANGFNTALTAVGIDLKKLPPAQPEQRWILCDEKMPEEHEWLGTKKFGTTISDEVYVTFENEKGERFCKHMSFQNGELSRYDKVYMEAWYKGSRPISWMPLPEPYKEGAAT